MINISIKLPVVMQTTDVIVIGGGAAGLIAAGTAASCGARTLLLEKNDRLGWKLSITGKGRCNLTNIAVLNDFISHFGRNGKFLRTAFSRFFSSELIEFFNELGLKTIVERGGRVFPADETAHKVVSVLKKWTKDNGVIIKTGSPVSRLIVTGKQIEGVQLTDSGKRAGINAYLASSVIVATGGASYPATGSTGDGYQLAESVGHSIIPIRPSLTPVETAGNIAKRLQGLSLKNVQANVYINRRKKASEFGDMVFTGFGLSGPIILTLSRFIVDALRENNDVTVSIDLKSALDEQKLDARIIRDITASGRKKFSSLLKGLLPAKLIPVCIEQVNIPADITCSQATSQLRKRLRLWLKDFRFKVTGYRPFTEAIITAGGVNVREIDPQTMQSRLVDGLYFAGEVLDIDGDTGGYNLQAAFSTGWLAGISAANK